MPLDSRHESTRESLCEGPMPRMALAAHTIITGHNQPQPHPQPRRHLQDQLFSIEDTQPEVVELLLKFMYGCLDVVPPQSAPLLFAAADRYGLAPCATPAPHC